MSLLVKRFLVFAVPLLMLGSSSPGYRILVENDSGIELENISIASQDSEFLFGDLAERTQIGLGHADLQFGPQSPRNLQIAFKPKNGTETFTGNVEVPLIGQGETVKLSISSRLDLIKPPA